MALYTADFLQRVRAASDLAQVVNSYNIQLKRTGSNLVGLCPFHNEKTGSFNIRTVEQYFHCFGCGAKGDVFRFVQLMEKIEFPDAVKMLAERAGLPLEFESPAAAREAAKTGQERDALLWCCSRALDYFEENLKARGGKTAMDYLVGRGFTPETISQWRLGWAPDSWDGLSGFLLKNAKETAFREKVLEYAVRAGVLRRKDGEEGRSARHYDAFRGRVMFPIMNLQMRPVAFGGRVLVEKPEAGGKYINSAEGRLFEKRKVLFGLPQASKEIGIARKVVVVEGYTDVIMCHQSGIRNVVATLGTALTEEHIQLLKRHVGENGGVVAFFDADAAGEKATERAISLFMREDLPLSVVRDLELKDACEFIPRQGAEEFIRHLNKAEDGFSYMLSRTLGKAKGRSVSEVGMAVKTVMEVVNLCPNPVTQAIMRSKVAAEAGVPESTLPAAKLGGGGKGAPGGVVQARARPAERKGLSKPNQALQDIAGELSRGENAKRRRETRLLRYMWEEREWCARILDAYPPVDWRNPVCAELAEAVRDAWEVDDSPDVNEIRDRFEGSEASEILAGLFFPDIETSDAELTQLLAFVEDEREADKAAHLLKALGMAQAAGDGELEDRLLAEYTAMQAARKQRQR